jgi:Tol biopolymer transport system component
LATLERQPLTSPPKGIGDIELALAPDGRHLAFVRSESRLSSAGIWAQGVTGDMPRRLVSGDFSATGSVSSGLAWTPDGAEIVFAGVRTDRPRMFRVRVDGGAPQPVLGIGQASYPSIQGGRMVYEQHTVAPFDIWRVPGREALPKQAPEALIVSSRGDHCPDYSPDGRKIAFASVRTGIENIWICDSDGSNPAQLTDLARISGWPRWSPDGRQIVFDSLAAGDWNLHVIDAEGGVPRRLTTDPSTDHLGSWSRDGRWIYFCSDRTGRPQVWKIPAEGGPGVQVTRHGGYLAAESWDGQHLYYSKNDHSGVWRMPVAGGEETAIVKGPLAFRAWALGRSGLYYAVARRAGALLRAYAIWYLDFASGERTELFRKEGAFTHYTIAVSPDERWVLYMERPEARSELMLVENFR